MLGIFAGNATETVIWRATVVMVACWPIGYCVGIVAQRAVNSNIEAYKAAHPMPPDPTQPLEPQVMQVEADDDNQDQGRGLSAAETTAAPNGREADVAVTTGVDL